MYAIDYGEGIVLRGYKSLQAAKRAATFGLHLSERDVRILDDAGETVAVRRWHGRYDARCDTHVPARGCVKFGDTGFYGAWEVV